MAAADAVCAAVNPIAVPKPGMASERATTPATAPMVRATFAIQQAFRFSRSRPLRPLTAFLGLGWRGRPKESTAPNLFAR